MKHGVPQGSVLGPFLFLIYINDLHNSLKYCTVRHFVDDTHLLISDASPKKLQKYINLDLKQLCKWLRANKIPLIVSKTELLIFRHPLKKVNYEFKIKMNGKKLYPSNFVKYLGITIDHHLNFGIRINNISTKLSRVTGMLARIRHYVYSSFNLFRYIFFHTYGCQI